MLKQQMARLGKGALIYGVGSLLNRFIGFLLLPVFTSYLTPADFGVSSILSWVAFLITPVFSLGLGAAIAPCYFDGNNKERKETTIWTSFTVLAGSAFFLATLGIGFARPISQLAFQTPEYHYLVMISLLGTSLSFLSMPFPLYLQFEERAKLFVVLTTVTSLVSIGLSFLMVVVLGRGIQGMIEAGLIAQVVTLIVFLSLGISKIKFWFSSALIKELLRMGIPLIPGFAFIFILQQGNKYILQWFDGLDAVGIYTIGFNFGLVMSLFVSALQSAWVPYFMSFVDKHDEARVLFGRILTYYVFGFGTISLLFFIAAKPMVMLMTQPAFHEAYKVVGLSASANFLAGVFFILLPGMYFAKEVKYVSLIQLFAALVAIGLNLLLIPLFGLLGAAIALMVGFVAMAFFTQLWNLKRKHIYIQVQYEWKRVMQFALIYASYIVVFMFWERCLSLLGEVAISLVALAFLPIAMYGLLNSHERKSLWALVKHFTSKSAPEWHAKA